MRCHYIYDEEMGKVLIPGCYGTAIYDIHHCTCRSEITTFKQFERKEFNEKMKEKNDYIKELEKENIRLNRTIKKLLKKI